MEACLRGEKEGREGGGREEGVEVGREEGIEEKREAPVPSWPLFHKDPVPLPPPGSMPARSIRLTSLPPSFPPSFPPSLPPSFPSSDHPGLG
jgi:hypothetical protein